MASSTEMLGQVKFFSGLDDRTLRRIARLMTPVAVRGGKVLARQGAIGREFFVILDGEATVTVDGQTVRTLGSGDHFGEIALLAPARRSATVTAASDMTVEVLNRAEFADLLDTAPEVAQQMLKSMATILEDRFEQ